ncbi:MAG: hypothetical protein LBU80_02165 [Rikenellaceae bacterium]|jgi:hypothetical protein|nr:hypothetical protein [Rikenellaceae bacterium]
MQTDFQAIQAIAQNHVGAYHIGTVIEKAGCLFSNIEAHDLTQLINDLLFYAGNPECAKDLGKQAFVDLTIGSISLVNMLTDLRGFYEDLVNHVKEGDRE